MTLTFMCFGPEESAVMNGRDTSVWGMPSSSRFAYTIKETRVTREITKEKDAHKLR